MEKLICKVCGKEFYEPECEPPEESPIHCQECPPPFDE